MIYRFLSVPEFHDHDIAEMNIHIHCITLVFLLVCQTPSSWPHFPEPTISSFSFSSLLSPFHSDVCTSLSSVAPLLLIFISPFSPGCFFQVFLSSPFELTHLKLLSLHPSVWAPSLLLLQFCYLWHWAQFPVHYITRLYLKVCSSFMCIQFCKLSSCCPSPIFGRSWGLWCCKALGNWAEPLDLSSW